MVILKLVDKPYVLRLELNGEIQDRVEEMPFDLSEITGQDVNILGLNDILANIKKAKTDENIMGIYIEIGIISAGFATREIRNALLDFKESGKFITTYSEIYTQGSYYLASVADYICMYPEVDWSLEDSTVQFLFSPMPSKKWGSNHKSSDTENLKVL